MIYTYIFTSCSTFKNFSWKSVQTLYQMRYRTILYGTVLYGKLIMIKIISQKCNVYVPVTLVHNPKFITRICQFFFQKSNTIWFFFVIAATVPVHYRYRTVQRICIYSTKISCKKSDEKKLLCGLFFYLKKKIKKKHSSNLAKFTPIFENQPIQA